MYTLKLLKIMSAPKPKEPAPTQTLFQLPDLFSPPRNSPYEPSLRKFKQLLEKQFNQGSSIDNVDEFKKIFKQIVMLRCDSLKISLIVLMMCFRRAGFIQDLGRLEKENGWDGQRKSSINTLRKILENCNYNPNGNPISDMKEIISRLLSQSQVCSDAVYKYITEDQSKQLFHKTVLSPQRPQNKNKNFRRLVINKIHNSVKNGKFTQKIQKLKEEEEDFVEEDIPRYCYAYLYPRSQEEGVVGFWVVCVMAHRMEKLVQAITQEELREERYIGEEQEEETQQSFSRIYLQKLSKLSKSVQQKNKTQNTIQENKSQKKQPSPRQSTTKLPVTNSTSAKQGQLSHNKFATSSISSLVVPLTLFIIFLMVPVQLCSEIISLVSQNFQ